MIQTAETEAWVSCFSFFCHDNVCCFLPEPAELIFGDAARKAHGAVVGGVGNCIVQKQLVPCDAVINDTAEGFGLFFDMLGYFSCTGFFSQVIGVIDTEGIFNHF